MRAELHHFLAGKLPKPFVVIANFGFALVENFENLLQVRFRVLVDLLAIQRRSRLRLPSGVADHRRKIANQKNGGVAHILKRLQFSQHHGVAQMNIRGSRIHSQIHPQRFSGLERLLELGLQLLFANNFRRALFQVRELLVHRLKF